MEDFLMRFIFGVVMVSLLFWFNTCRVTDGAGTNASLDASADSPFGIHGKTFDYGLPKNPPQDMQQNFADQYQQLGFTTADDWNKKIPGFEKDIGIRWDRVGIGLLPGDTPATLIDNFIKRTDIIVQRANQLGIHLVLTVSYQNRLAPGEEELIQKLVERYDGDGINDMPGLTMPVRYWQIGNEPEGRVPPPEYLKLLKAGYTAIKKACPSCKVLIAGQELQAPPNLPIYLDLILADGGAAYFDIMDIHSFGNAQGDYKQIEQRYQTAQQIFKKYGISKEIWITETGTPSGSYLKRPGQEQKYFQSEQEQANDLVRRYILSLGLGIKKIFWAWGLIEDWGFGNFKNGYFDHTGLIYNGLGYDDPGAYIKKLSYYAYKKMTEKLEGADWSKTNRLTNLPSGVYGVQFIKQGKAIYVLWIENKTQTLVTLTLSGITTTRVTITESVPNYDSGNRVLDYATAFASATTPVQNGRVTFILREKPVYIE